MVGYSGLFTLKASFVIELFDFLLIPWLSFFLGCDLFGDDEDSFDDDDDPEDEELPEELEKLGNFTFLILNFDC